MNSNLCVHMFMYIIYNHWKVDEKCKNVNNNKRSTINSKLCSWGSKKEQTQLLKKGEKTNFRDVSRGRMLHQVGRYLT